MQQPRLLFLLSGRTTTSGTPNQILNSRLQGRIGHRDNGELQPWTRKYQWQRAALRDATRHKSYQRIASTYVSSRQRRQQNGFFVTFVLTLSQCPSDSVILASRYSDIPPKLRMMTRIRDKSCLCSFLPMPSLSRAIIFVPPGIRINAGSAAASLSGGRIQGVRAWGNRR